jgi:hypothetical protein
MVVPALNRMVVPALNRMAVPVTVMHQTAEAAHLAELHLVQVAEHQTAPAAMALVALQREVSTQQQVLPETLTLVAHRTVVPEQK